LVGLEDTRCSSVVDKIVVVVAVVVVAVVAVHLDAAGLAERLLLVNGGCCSCSGANHGIAADADPGD
jgi:hypothetical protein